MGPSTSHLRWTRRLEGPVNEGAAVGVDGSVLIASDGGVLHALDPSTGRDRWTYDGDGTFGGEDLSVTPAVLGDGTILWPAPGHRLVALSAAGKQLWTLQLRGLVLSPALGSGGRVYVQDMSGQLTAIDTGTNGRHTVAWTIQTGTDSFGSPAIAADGTIYVTAGRTLFAVADDGTRARLRWSFAAPAEIEVSAAVATGGTVVLGSNGDVEQGVTPTGHLAWSFRTGTQSYSSAVTADGDAYFGDNNGFVTIVNATTGALIRREQGLPPAAGRTSAGVGVWTAPLVDAAGNTYVGTAAGHIDGYGPTGGKLWDIDTGGQDAGYPMLTADGLLVLGSNTGILYGVSG
jgi:outer membrane protein assembly factor BamB